MLGRQDRDYHTVVMINYPPQLMIIGVWSRTLCQSHSSLATDMTFRRCHRQAVWPGPANGGGSRFWPHCPSTAALHCGGCPPHQANWWGVFPRVAQRSDQPVPRPAQPRGPLGVVGAHGREGCSGDAIHISANWPRNPIEGHSAGLVRLCPRAAGGDRHTTAARVADSCCPVAGMIPDRT